MNIGTAFDQAVNPGGYAWWYIDALSDDDKHGLTLIGFIGSVFSPYYARARARGRADACDHCAINVALYGDGPRRWSMTERGRGALHRSDTDLSIGPSKIRQTANGMSIRLAETAVPIPRPICGQIRIEYLAPIDRIFLLDERGRHRWRPIAPLARIAVDLDRPRLQWTGWAYVDMNTGDEPLEHAFSGWQWSRTSVAGASTTVYYDVRRRDDSHHFIGMHCTREGEIVAVERPPWTGLPKTRWRIDRYTRAFRTQRPWRIETLEDTPFYARTLLRTRTDNAIAATFHESLDLRRFARPWVQAMLPFRMPRRG